MKKESLTRGIIIILVICFFANLLRYSYAMSSDENTTTVTFTKKELQDIVVSTGLSYLYNNKHSDYDQYTMEEESRRRKTFNFRTFNESPEMVSRSSKFYIDCSSFVTSAIKYSLGYDFSDFYSKTGSYIFHNSKNIAASYSKERFKIAYNQYGKAINTDLFANIGASRVSNEQQKQYINLSTSNVEESDLYKITNTSGTITDVINKTSNNDIVVYHYEVSGNEANNGVDKVKIKSNVVNLLEPGDIVIYRRKKADGSEAGHVMLFVGYALDTTYRGFVHATGASYTFDLEKDVNNGFDDFSIRYDNVGFLKNKIFNPTTDTASSSRAGASFTILRPINNYYNVETNKYEMNVCTEKNCGVGYLDRNAITREKLNELKIEQYASINTKSVSDTNDLKKTISSYNSVNDGDTIRYNLYILNKAKMEYCSSTNKEVSSSVGTYDTKDVCEKEGYTWKIRNNSNNTTYENLTIVGKIPENTKYIEGSCSHNCTYDKENKLVKWEIKDNSKTGIYSISASANNELTFWYEVEVDMDDESGDKIVNDGMEIHLDETEYKLDESKHSLEDTYYLSSLTTKVNPTINEMNMNLLEENVNKFINLYDSGKITYDNTESEGYNKNLDSLTTKTSLSELGFIKMMYYNMFGIDLNYLVKNNIVPALFDSIDIEYPNAESGIYEKNYLKKTEEEIANIDSTNTKSINLNKMLVKGMYGGQLLKSNDNLDRAKYLRVYDLEVGDIIIFFDYNYPTENETNDAAGIKGIGAYMFYGLNDSNSAMFVRFEKNGLITYKPGYDTTGLTLFRELYRKGLFVVLRPSQLYGTTVKFDYNGATKTGDKLYVAYNEYKNIDSNIPTMSKYTVTLNYNNDITGYPTVLEGTNTFAGWYSDSEFKTKITNKSTVPKDVKSQTLYAKWTHTKKTLPNPNKVGFYLEGWYSDEALTKKVGNAGDEYLIDSSCNLYAKWEPILIDNLISSDNYVITEDYIYTGFSEFKISEINNLTNFDLVVTTDNNLLIKNNDIEIKKIPIYTIISEFEVDSNKKSIYLNLDITTEDFYEKIIINNNINCKVYRDDVELTEIILDGDILKIYYLDKIIDSYTIKIKKINFNKLQIDEEKNVIYNLNLNSTYDDIISSISTSGNIKIISNNKEDITGNDTVKTNDIIKISFSDDIVEYKISVIGDITGTGNVTIGDIAKLYQGLKGRIHLNYAEYLAGDVIEDGEIAINDVSKLYAYNKKKISTLK